eukprot:3911158-Rhodomonas_salina.1
MVFPLDQRANQHLRRAPSQLLRGRTAGSGGGCCFHQICASRAQDAARLADSKAARSSGRFGWSYCNLARRCTTRPTLPLPADACKDE